jgi:hypothetical protein
VSRFVGRACPPRRGFSRDIEASKRPASTRRIFRRACPPWRAFRLRRRDSSTQEILLLSECSRMRKRGPGQAASSIDAPPCPGICRSRGTQCLTSVQARVDLLRLFGLHHPQSFAIRQINQAARVVRNNARDPRKRLDRLWIRWISRVQNCH